jgi:hypothetical protein
MLPVGFPDNIAHASCVGGNSNLYVSAQIRSPGISAKGTSPKDNERYWKSLSRATSLGHLEEMAVSKQPAPTDNCFKQHTGKWGKHQLSLRRRVERNGALSVSDFSYDDGLIH